MLIPVGSARVMADQLARLITATSDPAVTLQIVPMGTTRTVISPAFTVLSSADPRRPRGGMRRRSRRLDHPGPTSGRRPRREDYV